MAVSKPGWLRSWLSRLNWDILVWKIYVGDAIEDAIDWSLAWINWGIDQANNAYNWALQALNRANEVWRELTSSLHREIHAITNRISTWWSELGEWWSARSADIRDWISIARSFLQDQLNVLGRALDNLRIAWDNYWRDVVPTLLSIDKWRAFWGGAWQSISDWWGARLDQVKDLLATATDPITTEVNRLAGILDMIKDFIDDPLSYILGKLIKVTKAYQDILLKLWDKVMDALWG